MTTEELHQKDVENGTLQTVEAGGRVHVVAPDPNITSRWITVATYPSMAEANAFMAGWHMARSQDWF